MAQLARVLKSPSEQIRRTVDYSQRLAPPETIVSHSFVVTPTTSPAFNVVTSIVSTDGKKVIFYVNGGVDKQEYKLEIFITTNDSQILEDTIQFTIREQ